MIKYFEMEPGQRWGALTAVKNTGRLTEKGHEIWEWECECGKSGMCWSVHSIIKATKRDCGCGAADKYRKKRRGNAGKPGWRKNAVLGLC